MKEELWSETLFELSVAALGADHPQVNYWSDLEDLTNYVRENRIRAWSVERLTVSRLASGKDWSNIRGWSWNEVRWIYDVKEVVLVES